jgi:hypothetical protein
MQLQCKLYDEWLEVMSDYSTVFSQDRGLPIESAATASSAVSILHVAIQFLFEDNVRRFMPAGAALCITALNHLGRKFTTSLLMF